MFKRVKDFEKKKKKLDIQMIKNGESNKDYH